MTNACKIRRGRPEDIPQVLALIRELAEYERAADEVEISEEELLEDGFGRDPAFGLYVADDGGEIRAIAIYYTKYSTWKGRSIYLEDLVVRENHRREGLGRLLFEAVVREAARIRARRMEWQVLEWNEPAISFYRSLGAELDAEWINGRLREKQILEFPFQKSENQ